MSVVAGTLAQDESLIGQDDLGVMGALTDPDQLGLGSTFQQFMDPLDLFGVRSQQAATDAYEQQVAAGQMARKFQENMFNRLKDLQKSYMDAGVGSIGIQSALVGAHGPEAQEAAYAAYMSSPEIQYAVDAGMDMIDQDSSVNQKLLGGGRLQALQDYGLGIAAQDYDNYLNRLGFLSGLGQAAASAVGGVGVDTATGIADTFRSVGAGGAGSALAAQQAAAQSRSGALNAMGGLMGAYGGQPATTTSRQPTSAVTGFSSGGNISNYQFGGDAKNPSYWDQDISF